jgi:phage shock protein A
VPFALNRPLRTCPPSTINPAEDITMPLIDRFTRLISADLHALIDRIEEPELLLRQAVRELDEELARLRQRARALEREQDQRRRDERSARERLARLDEELDLCLAAGDDTLARHVVRHKLDAERRAAWAAAGAATAARAAEDLDQHRLAGEEELTHLRAELAHATAPAAIAGGTPAVYATEDIDIALLREKERRAGR